MLNVIVSAIFATIASFVIASILSLGFTAHDGFEVKMFLGTLLVGLGTICPVYVVITAVLLIVRSRIGNLSYMLFMFVILLIVFISYSINALLMLSREWNFYLFIGIVLSVVIINISTYRNLRKKQC